MIKHQGRKSDRQEDLVGAQSSQEHKGFSWSLLFAAASAISAVLGVSVFGSTSLIDGINKLIGQVEKKQSEPTSGASAPLPVTVKDGSDTPPDAGSISQTCAGLAKRAVDAMDQGFLLDGERLQKMMSDLRCNRGGKP